MGRMELSQAIRLVLRGKEISGEKRFGRIALMKHLYFLQEVGGVNLGIKFELYTWGPFASDVLVETKNLCALGLATEQSLGEDKGYNISLNGTDGLPSVDQYDAIRLKLKSRKPQELEAMATLHKVSKMLQNPTKESVVDAVKGLKPYLRLGSLGTLYDEMRSWGWVE